jgi:nicotinamidase-related amidase
MKRQPSAINDSAIDSSTVALLIVDMLSDFDADELSPMFAAALQAAKKIASLRSRVSAAGIPVLYINDNMGRWRSAGPALVERATKTRRGRAIVDLLAPRFHDYLLLKPKHSVFFSTPLDTLLSYMGVRVLILTGMTSTQCILFSAMDAYVRDFKLYIPRDCVVSERKRDAEVTEYLFRAKLKADTRESHRLRIPALKAKHHGAA